MKKYRIILIVITLIIAIFAGMFFYIQKIQSNAVHPEGDLFVKNKYGEFIIFRKSPGEFSGADVQNEELFESKYWKTLKSGVEEKKSISQLEQLIQGEGDEIVLRDVNVNNWQVYTDTERGFGFKYPKNWTIKQIGYQEPKKYKNCNDMLGREWGGNGCEDEFAGYNVKAVLSSKDFLCLVPEMEITNDASCVVVFQQVDSILENVGSAVNVYERNYTETFKKPFKYIKTKGDVVVFNNANFRTSNDQIVSVFAYDQSTSKMIFLNADGDLANNFTGIIQTITLN